MDALIRWFIDSGATDHASNNLEFFNPPPVPCHGLQLQMGDGNMVDVIAKGTAILRINEHTILELEDTFYAPTLVSNFISIKKLQKSGYDVHFPASEDHSMAIIYKECKIVFKAFAEDDLFEVNVSSNIDRNHIYSLQANEMSKDALIALEWHRRLGHLNFGDLFKIRKKLNIRIPQDKIECVTCQIAKCKRENFKTNKNKAKEIGERIHSDLSGIIRTPNAHRFAYFLTFIDEFSRYVHTYLCKSKQDVFRFFIEFRAKVKSRIGVRIKRFRTDNGTEYLTNEFRDFLSRKGILHERTPAHTPQANGISERTNQTLENCTRAMLHDAKMSIGFWPYATKHATYLRNRSPSSAIEFKIPYEVWTGNTVEYGNLHRFGQFVIYKDNSQRLTFENPGRHGRFVGYDDEQSVCLIYDNQSRTIIRSQDVKFIENENTAFNNENENLEDENLELFFTEKEPEIIQLEENSLNQVSKFTDDDSSRNTNQTFWQTEADSQMENNSRTESQTETNSRTTIETETNSRNLNQPEANSRTNANSSETFNYNLLNENQHSILDETPPALQSSIPETETNQAEDENDQDLDFEIDHNLLEPNETPVQIKYFTNQQLEAYKRQYPENANSIKRMTGRPRWINVNNRTVKSFRHAICSVKLSNYNQMIMEARSGPEAQEWITAMDNEYDSLIRNGTWQLVNRKPRMRILRTKWVLSEKNESDRRFKARFVAKGYAQRAGQDFHETYAPTLKYHSVRLILSIAIQSNWRVHHVDVKTAYLNSPLDEELYINQPFCYEDGSGRVCRLLKSIYGLKQSARCWFMRLRETLLQMGFRNSMTDTSVYFSENREMLIGVYVDDILIASADEIEIENFKNSFRNHFEISDRRIADNFLGIKIEYQPDRIYLSQPDKINALIELAGLEHSNPCRTPIVPGTILETSDLDNRCECATIYRSILGSLQYIARATRPDLTYAVNTLASYANDPFEKHMLILKRVVRYLKGSANRKLCYTNETGNSKIYTDSNFVGGNELSICTSGVMFFHGSNIITWYSLKQSVAASSTCEAELAAAHTGAKEAKFFFELLTGLKNGNRVVPIDLFCDNLPAVRATQEGRPHNQVRQYSTAINILANYCSLNIIKISHLPGSEMPADCLTKPLTESKFTQCIEASSLKLTSGGNVRMES